MELDFLLVITWILIIIAPLFVLLFLFTAYYIIRLELYFRKNEPKKLAYLRGKDLEKYDRIKKVHNRNFTWLFTNNDEDNSYIVSIKKKLRLLRLIGIIMLSLIFLLTTLLVIYSIYTN